ncbi:CPBP family intramembrane glutamic endopeptidase [Natrialba swarupiae]|uniref:CPBP family intramembrane metalloprotease n=1 Tax=Natrialba swarupiae TaxID=2448032 RepID=A0A5D5AJE4_9EURY|nr:type II CAAX endopeptidase family protein [Natrialba swarupiae]TYT61919.1 CPBP family intramembrane metalloprotease [Natrialba swarupiae]
MTDNRDSESSEAHGTESDSGADDGRAPEKRQAASSLSVILAVSRAERRRFDHRHTSTRRKKAVAYVALALMLPVFGAMVWGAYRFGTSVGDGGMDGLLTLTRWYVPVVIGLYVLAGANEAGKRLLGFEACELLLTTVRDRDLVLGLLLADLRESGWYLLGPTAVLVLVFGVGVGSPTLVAVATVAAVLVTLAATLVGYVVGLGARLGLRHIPLSSSAQSALSGVASVGVFLLFVAGGAIAGQTGASFDLGETSPAELAPEGPPPLAIGYYADFFFVGTPMLEGIGYLALASGALVVAAIPLAVRGTIAITPRLWRVESHGDSTDSAAASTGDERQTGTDVGDRREWPWLEIPTGYVADGVVHRAIRTPDRSLHVVYYLVGAGYVVVSLGVADSSLLATAVGASLVLLGIWLAGGAVGLNPIGDEGSMLGQLVLAEYSPETFVRARILVGTAIGLPLVLGGTALSTINELGGLEATLVGGFLAAMVPVSACFAVGVGTLLPRSEPGTVLEKFEVRPPETLAILVHGAVTTALAAGGAFLLIGDLAPAARVGGLAAVALCSLIVADAGYRFAVSGIAGYGRPQKPDPVYALELVTGLGLLGLALSLSLEIGMATQLPLSGPVQFIATFVAGFAGWALVGVVYLYATGRSWGYLDVAVPDGRDGRYLAVGLVTSLAAYGAFATAVWLFELPVVSHAIAEEVGTAGPAFALLLAALILLVNAPVEEFLFRNVLQKRLTEAISAGGAIVAVSILFAAVHLPVYASADPVAVAVSLLPLVVVSIVWGWVYERSGNLAVPALCHGLYNVAIVVVPVLAVSTF